MSPPFHPATPRRLDSGASFVNVPSHSFRLYGTRTLAAFLPPIAPLQTVNFLGCALPPSLLISFHSEIKWHGEWLISRCIFHLQRSTRYREAKRRGGGGGRKHARWWGGRIKLCDRSPESLPVVQMVESQKVKALDALEEALGRLLTLNWPWLFGSCLVEARGINLNIKPLLLFLLRVWGSTS